MAKAKRSTPNLDIDTQDVLENVRAKLAFLQHVRCGDFAAGPGKAAVYGEYLILDDCRRTLANLVRSEGR